MCADCGSTERKIYNRGDVVVTDRYFYVAPRGYRIAELGDVVRARGSVHVGVVVGLVIAALDGVAGIAIAVLTRSPAAIGLSVASLIAPCLVAGYCHHRWPPSFELRADYRGTPVTLFRTRDETEFGKVGRALRRAFEAADEASL
jgi:Family of unknown function (DUF6232)